MTFTSTPAVAASYVMLAYGSLFGTGAAVVPPSETAGMAARDWALQEIGAAYQPPTFKGIWDKTSAAFTGRLDPTPKAGFGLFDGIADESQGTHAATKGVTTNPYRVCVYRGVSPPLAKQRIHGTVNSAIEVFESNADAQLFWFLHGYATVGNTDVVRGTMLDNYAEDSVNEWPTTAVAPTPFQTPQTMTAVDLESGDRMVWEIGYISRAANDRTGTVWSGEVSTAQNSALQFSFAIQTQGLLASLQVFTRDATAAGLQRVEVGFPPKAAIIVASGAGLGDAVWSLGVTDMVGQACRSACAQDNVAAAQDSSGDSREALIWLHDAAESTQARAVFWDKDETGWNLAWLVQNTPPGVGEKITVLTLGGEDLEAKLGIVQGPMATGVPQVKGVDDVGFPPDLVFFLPSRLTRDGVGVNPVAFNQNIPADFCDIPGLGFATFEPIVNCYSGAGELDGANPTQTFNRQRIDKSIYVPELVNSGTLGDPRLEGSVTGRRPHGFEITWSTIAAVTDNFCVTFLALRGLRAQVIPFNTPFSTDDLTWTVPTNFMARALIGQSYSVSASSLTNRITYAALTLGFFARGQNTSGATFSSGASVAMADAVTPTQTNRRQADLITNIFPHAGAETVLETVNVSVLAPTNIQLTHVVDPSQGTAQAIILALGDDDFRHEFDDPPGGGTTAVGTNPSADEDLATAVTPLVFGTLQTDSGEKRYAKRPISAPAAYPVPGFIEPRFLSVGPIRRELSDWNGGMKTGSCTVELSDTDHALRTLAAAGRLINQRMDLYLATETQIKLNLVPPRRIFQGVVTGYSAPTAGMGFVLQLEDFFGAKLSAFGLAKQLPSTALDVATFPNLRTEFIGKAEPNCYGLLSDESLGTLAEGVVPCLPVGNKTFGGATWGELLVCRGAVKMVQSWFSAGTNDGRRHKEQTSSEGRDFLIPGHAGWNAWTGSSAMYRTINGKRYTVIYVRGPRLQRALDGTVPIAVNLAGYESVGDGTGTLIDSLPLQAQHMIVNFGGLQAPPIGNWLAIPTVGSPAYARVHSASFLAVKTASEARLAGGYKGAWMLGWDQQTQDMIAVLGQICRSGDFSIGPNRQGQIYASMETSSTAAVLTLRDVSDVLKETLVPEHKMEQLFNVIQYQYARRYVKPIANKTPAAGAFLVNATPTVTDFVSGNLSLSDATSITNHGERVFELDFEQVREAATALSVVTRKLARHKNGPRFVPVATGMQGTPAELGDNLSLPHYAGLGASGYTGTEKFRVIATIFDSNKFSTAFECHDVTGL